MNGRVVRSRLERKGGISEGTPHPQCGMNTSPELCPDATALSEFLWLISCVLDGHYRNYWIRDHPLVSPCPVANISTIALYKYRTNLHLYLLRLYFKIKLIIFTGLLTFSNKICFSVQISINLYVTPIFSQNIVNKQIKNICQHINMTMKMMP